MAKSNTVFMEDYGLPGDTPSGETVEEREKSYHADLHDVVKTPEGARVVCYWLERLGTFDPAWSDKNARMAQQTVLKDAGNELLDDLAVAHPNTHDDIQRMMRIRRKLITP